MPEVQLFRQVKGHQSLRCIHCLKATKYIVMLYVSMTVHYSPGSKLDVSSLHDVL